MAEQKQEKARSIENVYTFTIPESLKKAVCLTLQTALETNFQWDIEQMVSLIHPSLILIIRMKKDEKNAKIISLAKSLANKIEKHILEVTHSSESQISISTIATAMEILRVHPKLKPIQENLLQALTEKLESIQSMSDLQEECAGSYPKLRFEEVTISCGNFFYAPPDAPRTRTVVVQQGAPIGQVSRNHRYYFNNSR